MGSGQSLTSLPLFLKRSKFPPTCLLSSPQFALFPAKSLWSNHPPSVGDPSLGEPFCLSRKTTQVQRLGGTIAVQNHPASAVNPPCFGVNYPV